MVGRTIEHHEIIGKIGEGSMGVVYKAPDRRLHRLVPNCGEECPWRTFP